MKISKKNHLFVRFTSFEGQYIKKKRWGRRKYVISEKYKRNLCFAYP